MGLIVRDWRTVDSAGMSALYAREVRRWRDDLAWDTTAAWAAVEQARTTWGLPGLVVEDQSGDLVGWTFYLEEDGLVRAGGLVAATPDVTRRLVDGLIEAGRRSGVERIMLFVYDRAPGLERELAARGFSVERQWYLGAGVPLAGSAATHDAAGAWMPWTAACVQPAARLLAEAYGGRAPHFAPHDRPAEWYRYVDHLVNQTGVGVLMPGASRVQWHGTRIDAVAIVTRIAPETAHLAQVAVAPALRRRGLAARLVEDACARAAAEGCTTVTLLVSAHNTAAGALYARLGFQPRAAFIAALAPALPVDAARAG